MLIYTIVSDSGKTLNQPWESVTIVDDNTRKKLNEIEPHGSDLASHDGV